MIIALGEEIPMSFANCIVGLIHEYCLYRQIDSYMRVEFANRYDGKNLHMVMMKLL